MMVKKGRKWYTNFRDPKTGRVIQTALGEVNKRRATIALGKLLERLEAGEEVVSSRRPVGRLGYPGDDERGRRVWELHIEPFFGGYKAQEITGELVEQYIRSRWGDEAPESTVKKELRVLKMAIQQAKPKWELPAFKYVRTATRTKKPLAPAMVEAAAAAIRGHRENVVGFRIMQYTGIEPADVVQLAPEHFESGFLRKKRSKSGRALNLPLHPELQRALDAVPWPIDRAQPILAGINAKSLATAVTRAFTAAGFPEYSAKDLRRYVASRLLDAGYSHDWIAKALGHAPGSRVTEGYSTAYDETLTRAFKKALTV